MNLASNHSFSGLNIVTIVVSVLTALSIPLLLCAMCVVSLLFLPSISLVIIITYTTVKVAASPAAQSIIFKRSARCC